MMLSSGDFTSSEHSEPSSNTFFEHSHVYIDNREIIVHCYSRGSGEQNSKLNISLRREEIENHLGVVNIP